MTSRGQSREIYRFGESQQSSRIFGMKLYYSVRPAVSQLTRCVRVMVKLRALGPYLAVRTCRVVSVRARKWMIQVREMYSKDKDGLAI